MQACWDEGVSLCLVEGWVYCVVVRVSGDATQCVASGTFVGRCSMLNGAGPLLCPFWSPCKVAA